MTTPETLPMEPTASVPALSRSARMRRFWWWTALAAVASFIAGLAIASALLPIIGPGPGTPGFYAVSGSAMAPQMYDGSTRDMAAGVPESSIFGWDASASMGQAEVMVQASLQLVVDDVSVAVESATATAASHGGSVETLDLGTGNVSIYQPGLQSDAQEVENAWMSLRIPADQVDSTLAELEHLGKVISTSINATDVTSTATDLRARVESLQASVQRLTELMSAADNVGDLIQAESALTERQAQLESYQQQLKDLDNRVAMSTISLQLSRTAPLVSAEPAGLWDGLIAGWASLVNTLNGLVVAVGFLLPWIAVLAVAAALTIVIVRLRRRARRTTTQSNEESLTD